MISAPSVRTLPCLSLSGRWAHFVRVAVTRTVGGTTVCVAFAFGRLTSHAPDWVRSRHMTLWHSGITLDAVSHVLCDAQEARHQRHVHGIVP